MNKPIHSTDPTTAWHLAMRTARVLSVAMAGLLVTLAPAQAQGPGHSPTKTIDVRQEAASMEDKIGVEIDTTLEFVDERGYPYGLRQLFPGDRPVILVPGYYSCPDMCGQVMEGMLDALNDIQLAPGDDYLIVNVSIDPRETAEVALQRKQKFLPKLLHVGGEQGWRFLTGKEDQIKALSSLVGFRYFWAEHDNRYAHPGALLFITPKGKLSRVITGTTFNSGDVRQAIVEASEGKLGSFWDEVRISCLTWDPRTQSYSLAIMTVVRVGGVITVLLLATMIFVMVRREKLRHLTNAPASPAQSTASV